MFEFSILAAFAAVVCWGFGDYFIQQTVRKIGSVQSLFFIGIIGSVLLLPLVWSEIPALLQSEHSLLLVWLGTLTFVVAIILFESLKEGKLSVIDVVFEIELPITIVLALVFFGEQLTLAQTLLIGMIFIGIILIALEHFRFGHMFSTLEKGVLIALIGSIGMGFVNFHTAQAARDITPLLAVFGPWVVFTILSFAVICLRKETHTLWSNFRAHTGIILGQSVLDTTAWILFAAALSQHNAAVITAITESYPALAVFLGVYLNREKIQQHQFAGAILALSGSILLGVLI